eukprot:TRINITY_DN42802_c0_g1_i1.p1 TRINITY_DN42802_c0_g1~~TRINITY_DN42802_c0_g1_i1.p1  ORF type:complete len:398 (-),score=86.42 TRINITY_DN42802_c0_g1_i1:221-1414(-)
MRFHLIITLDMLLTVATTGDIGAASDTQMQQAKLADEMGKFYRAQYAPATGPGTSQTDTQLQQAKLANDLGNFYRQQYAPPGVSMGGAASMQPASVTMYGVAGMQPTTQAQEAKRAFDIGSFYRSQYVPATVEAQIQAQQAQQTGLQQGSLPQTPPSMQATISEQQATPPTLLAGAPQQSSMAGPAPAATPHLAEDCTDLTQLKAWYDDKISSIQKYVPKDYQHFSIDTIKKDYEANIKRLKALPAKQDPAAIDPALLATAPTGFDSFRKSFKQKVAGWTQGVHAKSDHTADKVAQAAEKAQGKADRFADDAAKAAKIIQSGAADTKERLDKLFKESEHRKGSEMLALSASEPVRTHSLFSRFLACTALVGAIVAVGLELRRTRVSESDADVYLMQA